MSSRNDASGFALPAAIFALVVVGILVTAGFFVARQESQMGVATENTTEALYLAENGAAHVMSDWSNSSYNAMSNWTEQSFTGSTSAGDWSVAVTKMSPTTYFVDSQGTITRGGRYAGATRRVGVTVRVVPADMEPPAGLTTRGTVKMGGTSEVNGIDSNPTSWSGLCTNNTQQDKPGILMDPSGSVSTGGAATIDGNPAVQTDSAIADSTFTQFGDLTWNDLISLANKTIAGGTINNTAPSFNGDGSCDKADQLNWGDPLDPSSTCGDYFPVVYINSSATIQSGGVGQGVLLVDGDLSLRGDFTFYGVVVVQGTLDTQGSGNRIVGGVMSSNANLSQESLVGGSVIQQSTCASRRAIMNNDALARPRPLTNRSWVDLTDLSYSY